MLNAVNIQPDGLPPANIDGQLIRGQCCHLCDTVGGGLKRLWAWRSCLSLYRTPRKPSDMERFNLLAL